MDLLKVVPALHSNVSSNDKASFSGTLSRFARKLLLNPVSLQSLKNVGVCCLSEN